MSNISPEPKYIRPQDVARKYSVSPEFVYKSIKNGELPARKLAKNVWLIRPEDVDPWIESLFSRTEQAG